MSVSEERVGPDSYAQEKQKKEAYQAYLAINKTPSKLPIDSFWDSKVILLTEEDLKEIFNHSNLKRNWAAFYRKYPGAAGIIGLSRVGFDKDLSSAYVYIEFTCGRTCGNGYVATLKRGIFGWDVVVMEHLWVS